MRCKASGLVFDTDDDGDDLTRLESVRLGRKCGSFPTYVQRCPDLAIRYQHYSLALAFVGPARARSPALYQKGTRETRL